MVDNRQIRRGGAEGAWPSALSGTPGLAERAEAPEHPVRTDGVPAPPATAAPAPGTPVIGYASCFGSERADTRELKQQTSLIVRECQRRGLSLIEVVGEREPATGKGLARPGLSYALDRIQGGDANGLVVSELSRITCSAAELGTIIEWLASSHVRLIAAAHAFDTDCQDGRLAAQMLIDVSRWERIRLSERTRSGLEAARLSGKASGRGAVTDDPDLSERIAQMRARGMTLQAIADRLNEEGVPTIRGGAKWRHSSVQAAAGYRRSQNSLRRVLLGQRQPAREKASS
jgi:DNA invertase Pin-like site-specific DNA recombinase